MNINYDDIHNISYALCTANVLLNAKIEDLEEKGFTKLAERYKSNREDIEKAHKSLQKIRKELHLSDDYAYDGKFGK